MRTAKIFVTPAAEGHFIMSKRKTATQKGPKTTKRRKTAGVFQASQNNYAQTSRNDLLPEPHYFDADLGGDATTTPTIVPLASVGAGDTNVVRDGNKIAMRSLNLRISYDTESIAQNVRARFVVVVDLQSNGTSPAWTDVYDSATIESQRLVSALPRFVVLMDKTVSINSTTSTAGAFQKAFFKKHIKLPNIVANYASAAAAVALTNSLTLMYISDVAAGGTDLNVAGRSRLTFVG